MANRTIVKGNIGNALHSVAPDHIVTTADEIFDENLQQYQSEVNRGSLIFTEGVYDVSEKNPTGGPNSDGKFTLEYILSNADTLIPASVRKGGMSIKFVHTSDNKYVQYRLMSDTFSTTVANWQGVDDEPTAGSENLVKSGWVANSVINETLNTKGIYDIPQDLFKEHLIIADDGTTTESISRDTTVMIPVQQGDIITWYNMQGNSLYRTVACYDADGNYITGEGSFSASSGSSKAIVVNNARFVRFIAYSNVSNKWATIQRIALTDGVQFRVNSLYAKETPLAVIGTIWSQDFIDQNQNHIAIPVNSGDVITVTNNATIYYALLKSYDTPHYGDTPDFCDGYSGVQGMASPMSITVPSDCKWLILNSSTNASDVYTSISINGVDVLHGVYGGLFGGNILKEKDLSLVPGKNLANPANVVPDYNVSSDGSIGRLEGWAYVSIDVSSINGKYISFGGVLLGRNGYYAFYNGSTKIDYGSCFTNGKTEKTVLVPTGATTLYFDIKTTLSPSDPYDNMMANIGQTLDDYTPYEEYVIKIKDYKIAGKGGGSEDYSQEIQEINDRLDSLDAGFIAELPVSDGTDISVGYAYIEQSTGIVKIKMS